MKEFIGNKSIDDTEGKSVLQYYIVQNNGRYGIEADLLGMSFSTACVYNISDKEIFTRKLAKRLLSCEILPISLIDIIEDIS